ncbi:MAG TPA: zf-HC2 domain-containing protein [Thermoanaerobaculia bacterium]|nr:zf-HC2 domain-containing protein [Thermoanaerobaculia bacterium]
MKRDETLHGVIEEILGNPDGHPDADELVAYHEGTLAPGDAQRIQDHLVACRECALLIADLEGLGDSDFGADEDLREETAELVWKNVRQQIRREEGPPNVIPFRGRESPRDLPGWLRPLAAMLVISTLALSGWVAYLRGQVKDLSSPQLNAPILDLYPAGSTRGENPAVQTVPPDARLFTVVLNPAGRPAFQEYELQIVDAEGKEIRRDGGLKPNPYGSFSVTLSRDLLGAGDFRVRLVGIDSGGSRQTVEEYALRIP